MLDNSHEKFDYSTIRAAEKRLAKIVDVTEVVTGYMSSHKVYQFQVFLRELKPGILSRFEKTEKYLVSRRYSDFEKFKGLVSQEHYDIILPALPDKNSLNMINKNESEPLKERAEGLEIYLNKILTNEILAGTFEFEVFFSRVSL